MWSSLERYGAASDSAQAAWAVLAATVYGIDERAGATEGGFEREKASPVAGCRPAAGVGEGGVGWRFFW